MNDYNNYTFTHAWEDRLPMTQCMESHVHVHTHDYCCTLSKMRSIVSGTVLFVHQCSGVLPSLSYNSACMHVGQFVIYKQSYNYRVNDMAQSCRYYIELRAQIIYLLSSNHQLRGPSLMPPCQCYQSRLLGEDTYFHLQNI